jgi:phosphonate transport system permease protein
VTDSAAVAAFERARRDLAQARRRRSVMLGAVLAIALAGAVVVGEVSPVALLEGLPGLGRYVAGTLPVIRPASAVGDFAEWYWGLWRWLLLLLDTLLIAFMGTLGGAAVAFLLCFPASSNLAANRSTSFACRRALEVARTVPELVYALIFVYAFGLGGLPGVLAIAVHSAGALGKLFAEVNENADLGPLDGVRAAGGNWAQAIGYGVVPQVLPNFVSYALLRFEINVRASAVIGFVGAGGIGQELYLVIRQFIYTDISALVLLLVAAIAVIDIVCERLRHRMIGAHALA